MYNKKCNYARDEGKICNHLIKIGDKVELRVKVRLCSEKRLSK